MNKQEAIEKVKEHGEFYSNMFGGTAKMVPVGPIIDIIFQIDEPQRVVVPKEVAEWIKDNKSIIDTLHTAYALLGQRKNDVSLWVNSNRDTFARAWLDGYKVEKEKLYTVEIPDPNRPDIATFLYKENGKVFIGTDIFLDEVPNYKWRNEPENQLTESEIKQDFEWAWDAGFAKEVE